MKKYLILLLISFLFLPSFVFATEYIDKIDIDLEVDSLDDAYTGNEARGTASFEAREGSYVSEGNGNVWISQCPTSEVCSLNDIHMVYDDRLIANRYTYLELEVFADPYRMNVDNPPYDFDKDHLDDIEVWINGVKRDDVIVVDYNNSWRMVHVFVPVTVGEYTGTKYTVTFNTNGGSAIDAQQIGLNHHVIKPEKPTQAGKVFVDWYEDAEFTKVFNFNNTRITKDTTLYAKWRDAIVTQMIDSIKIDFSISEVITDELTGNQAKSYMTVSGSENSHVSNGNGNKWMYQCPTSERCALSELTHSYDTLLSSSKYTFVSLEIFADPYGMDVDNPPYDFDKDHLDDMEVWINGVKRDDVIVVDYNNSWRMVHVFVPVEVIKEMYTVTFNTNGGNSIDSQTVDKNGLATNPGNPVRNGFKFMGWYKDEDLTVEYNFSNQVTSNITIYAKWNEILTSAGAHITVPVRGKLAPLDITSDDESKYKVQVDYWYLSDRDAGYPHVGADELLQPGKTYKLRFTFIPNEGYVFNDNPTTTLNGKVTQKYGVPSHCEYAFFVKDQLNQTKASTSSVKIEWEKRKDAKGYLVQVKSGSKWKTIKTITKNSTTNLTIKKLKAGTKYTYRVRAYKIVKNKKTIINTTNTITAITTPKNPEVTLTLKDYNAMNINIKGVKGGNNYAVQRSTDGKTYLLFKRVFEPTTIPQEDLVFGQKYYYRVQACNKNGYCSKWTTVSRVQTTKTPGFSIKTSSKKVTITMSKVNGADGYQIYRATRKNGQYTKIKEFSSEVELLEYVNKTTKGKTYYYKVRTFKLNTEGKRIYSPYSKIKSIKSK